MPDGGRYSEEEVGQVLRRVSELENADDNGVTREQLVAASTELGLDERLVHEALLEDSQKEKGLPLIPLEQTYDLAAKGPFTPEDWALLIADLRMKTRGTGTAKSSGTLYEWRDDDRSTHLSLAAGTNRVQVRVVARNYDVLLFSLPLLMMGAVIPLASSQAGNLTPAFIGGGIALFVSGLVASFTGRRRAQQAERVYKIVRDFLKQR